MLIINFIIGAATFLCFEKWGLMNKKSWIASAILVGIFFLLNGGLGSNSSSLYNEGYNYGYNMGSYDRAMGNAVQTNTVKANTAGMEFTKQYGLSMPSGSDKEEAEREYRKGYFEGYSEGFANGR